ncbi:unnamed protein product [Prorocentrum cordatum]|uniref:Reverse transcriptase domain-containing protein n=1 Tax=Prorocentrum cordatum TaxID=2364126 RepID=A0ABN9VQN3_9DINO|nr:unnamed protein product [Polarella glacialis]
MVSTAIYGLVIRGNNIQAVTKRHFPLIGALKTVDFRKCARDVAEVARRGGLAADKGGDVEEAHREGDAKAGHGRSRLRRSLAEMGLVGAMRFATVVLGLVSLNHVAAAARCRRPQACEAALRSLERGEAASAPPGLPRGAQRQARERQALPGAAGDIGATFDDVEAVAITGTQLKARELEVQRRRDFAIIAQYYPPKVTETKKQPAYKRTVRAMTQWLSRELAACPSRSVPVVMCDLNDGIGLKKSDDDKVIDEEASGLRKSDAEGPAGKRWVHMLPAIGKVWYSALMNRSIMAPDVHGYQPGRCKETPMLVSSILAWRAQREGRSFCRQYFDATNAFGSISQVRLKLATAELFEGGTVPMGLQRVDQATISVPCEFGSVLLRPGCGGMMGDPFMVAAWVRAFQPSVARWRSAMAAEGVMEGQMVATSPCDPDPIDLALCQYADDLELSHLGKPKERAASLLARAFAPELKARKAAIFKAFYSLGGFWFLKGVPFRLKRAMFLYFVVGTAVQNLEAYLPSSCQLADLQQVVDQLARKALRGLAHEEVEGVHSSWSNERVRKHWRLCSLAVELRVRRLKRLQAIAKRPERHRQWIAAHFGVMNWERMETMTEDGRLTENANPWARRVLEDLKALLSVEDAEWFLSELRITSTTEPTSDTHAYLSDLVCETEARQDFIKEPKWALKRGVEGQQEGGRKKLLTELGGDVGGGNKTQMLERMVKVLAALALTQAAELWDLIAAVYLTFLIPAASTIAKAMKEAGRDYHAQAKRIKEGPPFLHVFKAMIKAAYSVQGLSEGSRKVIENFWKQHVLQRELHDLAEQIRHCRVKDTRKKESQAEVMRITICFSTQWTELQDAVMEALKKENGVLKEAPRPVVAVTPTKLRQAAPPWPEGWRALDSEGDVHQEGRVIGQPAEKQVERSFLGMRPAETGCGELRTVGSVGGRHGVPSELGGGIVPRSFHSSGGLDASDGELIARALGRECGRAGGWLNGRALAAKHWLWSPFYSWLEAAMPSEGPLDGPPRRDDMDLECLDIPGALRPEAATARLESLGGGDGAPAPPSTVLAPRGPACAPEGMRAPRRAAVHLEGMGCLPHLLECRVAAEAHGGAAWAARGSPRGECRGAPRGTPEVDEPAATMRTLGAAAPTFVHACQRRA